MMLREYKNQFDEAVRSGASILVYTDNDSLPEQLRPGLNGKMALFPASALDSVDGVSWQSGVEDVVLDLRGGKIDLQRISALRARIVSDATRIIGLGDRPELGVYRALKQHGCDEYFLVDSELPLVFDYIARRDSAHRAGNIVVCPVRSGVGSSLVTAGLARFLSEDNETRILDLNWSDPTVNYWLGLDETGRLHELVGEAGRMDEFLLSQIGLSVDSGLHYYGGYDLTGFLSLNEEDSSALFRAMNEEGAYNIWKCDKGNPHCGVHVLDQADHAILVTDPDLSSLRNAKHGLERCREKGIKSTLVINTVHAEHDLGADRFASLVGAGDYVVIPRLRNLKQQVLDNITPGSEKSNIRKYIRKIAHAFDSRYAPAPAWWRWG